MNAPLRPAVARPLVSVVIPCFNQSKYAYEALLSAKRAYQGPLQLVIVNDGSTEPGTTTRLQELAARLANDRCLIEVVSQANRGLSGARNTGIRESRGDFVQLLDCDDLLAPGKIDAQIAHFAVAADLGVSITDCLYTNDSLDQFDRHSHLLEESNFTLADFAKKWERGFSIPIHCALFRASLFERGVFDEQQRAKEDWLFWVHAVAAGARIAYIGSPGAVYRVHDASLCRASPDIGRQWLSAALAIDPIVRETVPDFLDQAVFWYTRAYAGTQAGAVAEDGVAKPEPVELALPLPAIEHAAVVPVAPAERPRVSILIPVYQHFEFLQACIQSALAQMDGTVEIVLVDDCSPDPRIRPAILQAARTRGVKVAFNSQNLGISATLNRGVSYATGEYVALLDCDDLLAPNAIWRALAAIDGDGGCDYFFSDRYDISDQGETVGIARYGGYHDDRFTGVFAHDLLNGMIASHLKIIRKAAIERVGGFDAAFSGVQDWVMALEIASFGKFVYLPEPLYGYRVHPKTVTSSDRRAQFLRTNLVRRHYVAKRLDGRPERASRKALALRPAEIRIRDLAAQSLQQPLVLDTSAGLSRDELWLAREFNSYFDTILWSAPEVHSALLGYVWSPDVLEHKGSASAATCQMEEAAE